MGATGTQHSVWYSWPWKIVRHIEDTNWGLTGSAAYDWFASYLNDCSQCVNRRLQYLTLWLWGSTRICSWQGNLFTLHSTPARHHSTLWHLLSPLCRWYTVLRWLWSSKPIKLWISSWKNAETFIKHLSVTGCLTISLKRNKTQNWTFELVPLRQAIT